MFHSFEPSINYNGDNIPLTKEEFEFLKFLIEDDIKFHQKMFEDMASSNDLMGELGISEIKKRFEANKSLFLKLTLLNIDAQGMEK